MQTIIDTLDNLSEWLGITIAWLTLAMALVTCCIVVARYALNLGSIAMQESVLYMHGIVFMLGIAYTLKHRAHVRVDIVYQRLSVRTQSMIDIFGTLIFLLPVSVFLFFGSLDYVAFSWSVQETSAMPGGLPGVYLVKTLIPIMAALLFFQGIAELLRNLSVLLDKKVESST
ncbi:MAG TPA: C4-dicarboxylate ABC transporter permease [Gammaproteobacteria bacterium]|nr:C4-dicarboxylate ABC transporter permease [Gammaproteobacteria bacterium]|tara:strand:- start:6576 stop:7091 length:516 start_codon:yes stop_codon:yes gene_type:complete